MEKILDKEKNKVLIIILFFLLTEVLDDIVLVPIMKLVPLSNANVNVLYKLMELSMYVFLNIYLFKQQVFWKAKFSKGFIFLIIVMSAWSIALSLFYPNRVIKVLLLTVIGALAEEYLNRGLITGKALSSWFEKDTSYYDIWVIMIFSGLIFGLYHFSNIISQPIFVTLSQIIQATGLGVFLSACYLRTGGLVVPFLLHFMWDYTLIVQFGLNTMKTKTPHIMVSFFICSFFILISILMTRNVDKLKLVNKLEMSGKK